MPNLFNRNDGTFAAVAATDLSGSYVSSVGGLTGTILISGLTTSGGNTLVAAAAGVSGPVSSTLNNVPQWNSTSGNLLKDGITVGTGASNLVQLDGSAKLPAVDGSQLTGIPVTPTTSTYGVGTFAFIFNIDAGAIASGSTALGSHLASPVWTSGAFTNGQTQTGTWKNLSGASLGNNDIGYWVRTV